MPHPHKMFDLGSNPRGPTKQNPLKPELNVLLLEAENNGEKIMEDNKFNNSSDPVLTLPVGRINLGSLEIACESEIKKSNVWGRHRRRNFY